MLGKISIVTVQSVVSSWSMITVTSQGPAHKIIPTTIFQGTELGQGVGADDNVGIRLTIRLVSSSCRPGLPGFAGGPRK